jgi:hypothetical protein
MQCLGNDSENVFSWFGPIAFSEGNQFRWNEWSVAHR